MDKINDFFNTNKVSLILSLVGIVLLAGGVISSNILKKPPAAFPKGSLVKSVEISEVKVDVSGAVKEPGVYSLSSDSRVEDAIKKAGGFSDSANTEFISKYLNLSQKVSDGQKIYVPDTNDPVPNSGGVVSGVSTQSQIGVNSGSEKDLESLPGIGPVTAQKIIDSRPYSSLDDLVDKKAVSKSVFEKIKPLVNLN